MPGVNCRHIEISAFGPVGVVDNHDFFYAGYDVTPAPDTASYPLVYAWS